MEAAEVAQLIKSLALELGFAAVGITHPDPPLHLEVYFEWLEQGCQGEMEYLAKERSVFLRSHPAELLPGCQSVIVLAARYAAPSPYPQPYPSESQASTPTNTDADSSRLHPLSQGERKDGFPSPWGRGDRGEGAYGRIAAYAWGEDYHLVLKQRMNNLMQQVQEKVGRSISYRCFTDSAPILEREFAQRAGLGWIGKNTCLINPRLGSYLFLAEIFTDLPLPPDQPFLPDRCGTCQRCLQACPTRCILPNRTIDARRCISYLTIEHKSAIPLELRALLGDWVFGCDICQQVCPWNRRVSPAPSFSEFLSQTGQMWLPLRDILSMTQPEFKRVFQNSPLLRPKLGGLSRNAAVVLGNLARMKRLSLQEATEILSEALHNHPEALVRGHLAWSLAQLGSALAQRALQELVQTETDPVVKSEIETLFAQTPPLQGET